MIENGAKYHVTTRANRQEMIFETEEIKHMFLDVVKKAKSKFSFKIDNFCIMGNHFHLIIEPVNGSSLSKIMQWILSVFAIHFNKYFGLTGHVWGERFYSRIIRSIKDFFLVFDYICLNPIRAGLVKRIHDWQFSGVNHFHSGRFDIIDRPGKH